MPISSSNYSPFSGDLMGSTMGVEGFIGKFDNPVLLPSSAYYPSNLSAAFDWCRYYYHKIPNFRQVQKRIVRWFITDFEFPGKGSDSEKEDLRKYLKDVLDLPAKLLELGDDWGCYGNAFMRFHYPFIRYVVDKRGGLLKLYPLYQFPPDKVTFDLNKLTYKVPDPVTSYKTTIDLPFFDAVDRNRNGIKLIRMDPRYMRIIYNELSDTAKYIYKFNPYTKEQVRKGNILVVNTTPYYMLNAMSKNADLRFKDGEVFHFKGPTISGISYSDWGMPELMANFGQIYQIMCYLKADEAIARDFITPFRLFLPPPQSGQTDLIATTDGLLFQDQMSKIIENRRKDPTSIYALPMAVTYQEVGGTGKQYTPKDLLEYQTDQLLNGCGCPRELYTLSLQTAQIPTALRLVQNSAWFIYNNFNKCTQWVTKKVLDYTKSEQIEIRWQEPQMADNMENMNLLVQLVNGGVLPYDTIFKRFGLYDAVSEIVKRRKQDLEVDIKTQKAQEDMQRKQEAQAILHQNLEDETSAMPGGMPGAMPITDKYQQAADIAQQWLRMPEGPRRQSMSTLRGQDIDLYALAKQVMDEQRAQLRSEGERILKDENGYA